MFPGILATSTLFTAVFSAASIVWDREFGFLREMLVAPVRRARSSSARRWAAPRWPRSQATSCMLLAPLVDVPLDPLLVLTLLGESSCCRSR